MVRKYFENSISCTIIQISHMVLLKIEKETLLIQESRNSILAVLCLSISIQKKSLLWDHTDAMELTHAKSILVHIAVKMFW